MEKKSIHFLICLISSVQAKTITLILEMCQSEVFET